MFFLCHDCGELVQEDNVCKNAKNLPDPICQLCFIDLLEGRFEPGPVSKFYPKTEEERLLHEIFGKNDVRKFRRGSSQVNQAWVLNRIKGEIDVR
jgi:hypothetical protein